MSRFYTKAVDVKDGDIVFAIDVNSINDNSETAFNLVETEVDELGALVDVKVELAHKWAEEDHNVEVEAGAYSSKSHAIDAAADAASTAQDSIDTNADKVSATASASSASDDAAQVALDLVATNQDTLDTAQDSIDTNADKVATNADAASTAQDSIDTNADKVATAADRVVTTQDAIDTAADVVTTNADASATNQDAIDTAADVVTTTQDAIDTASDLVATNQDTIDTAADRVQTGLDVVDTGEDRVQTGIDRAKAHQWAEEDEDVEVETGEYSSYHWAQKSGQSALGVTTIVPTAPVEVDDADGQNPIISVLGSPSGGSTGQVLSKATGDNYDNEWSTSVNDVSISAPVTVDKADPSNPILGLDGLPSGGAVGQVLAKATSGDYDDEWADVVSDFTVNTPLSVNKVDPQNPIISVAGMPSGGAIDEVLTKNSGNNYDNEWTTLDKTRVGLSNVDDTSDADKPISTLTQAGLDGKESDLNLPASDGLILSSTAVGTRSWVGGDAIEALINLGSHAAYDMTGLATIDLDADEYDVLELHSINTNFTLSISNLTAGRTITIFIDDGGSNTITWPSGWYWGSGELPEITSGIDVVVVTKLSSKIVASLAPEHRVA